MNTRCYYRAGIMVNMKHEGNADSPTCGRERGTAGERSHLSWAWKKEITRQIERHSGEGRTA